MNPICARRFLVEGRVQGVWFRAATREQAQRLAVTGFARNLADGRVEVVAQGEAAALDALQDWLRQGPPLARVADLQVEHCEPCDRQGFTIA
jgi:acylphosphatase